MISFKNKTALVTGAGSGIGLAISKELIKRGAKVWLTDINEKDVKEASVQLGANANFAHLDVRDSDAIKKLVGNIALSEGSLDFMFNNAGIGIGGEMQDLGVEHFDRIIDINIRGVMNGIAAAYPLMVKQKYGCIVNTASAAGLAPIPLLTPYAMTKHAVVGLSRSLRIEGEHYGVQINALCPTAIETPILDSTGPSDLSSPWKYGARDYLTNLAPAYPVGKFAKYALDKVASNRELIVAPFQGRIVATLFRYAPGLVMSRIRKLFKDELKNRSSD
jgi:NAD(P)-dependent dehydrogenase (short-subunit alcohol dehydrogenase family)